MNRGRCAERYSRDRLDKGEHHHSGENAESQQGEQNAARDGAKNRPREYEQERRSDRHPNPDGTGGSDRGEEMRAERSAELHQDHRGDG